MWGSAASKLGTFPPSGDRRLEWYCSRHPAPASWVLLASSAPLHWNPMDCSPLGACVHGNTRQAPWSGEPPPPPGGHPDPVIEPASPLDRLVLYRRATCEAPLVRAGERKPAQRPSVPTVDGREGPAALLAWAPRSRPRSRPDPRPRAGEAPTWPPGPPLTRQHERRLRPWPPP